MAPVVAAVEDFFFASKIREAALHAGVEVAFATTVPALLAEAARPDVRLVVVDLNGASVPGPDAVRALKADPATAGVETVGYLAHVMVELRAAAEAAGCDRVLPRSAFVKFLPDLLAHARA